MEDFFRFIASPEGRGLRVAAGVTLICAGTIGKGKPKRAVAAAGLVPLSAGLFDKCLLGPFAGKPFSGKELRQQLNS